MKAFGFNRGNFARRLSLGNLEVKRRLAKRFVFRVHDPAGVVFVCGPKANARAGFGVHAVEGISAAAAANQTIACFHAIHAIARITAADSVVSEL